MTYQPRPLPPGARPRNQRTAALIRRDIIWQIGLPLGLALLLAIVIGVIFSVPSGAAARTVWADISLIFLIIPAAVMGLIAFALIGALCFGLYYVLRELPYYTKRGQDIVALVTYRVNGGAARISDVILSMRSSWAGVRRAADNALAYLPLRRSR